ncbi:MAG: TrkA family potassium uptake protein [Candidatus Omnitrophica bacterium]|nr:TrkA family potassium uptake protein [Candidatus Omnitrophota bacterium]MCF7891921.1 TrkA family potassium uptake protein [Candidatus Omnitrophota bacterium]MCF7896053.1 TrkA family potassium uptake protein [Candidatus Omnitrophota bacterium]MCF7897460.1 TrkA family potassium uptake protein [Candidatus Omnitrophota bacterium]MCF7909362.1 TrkA family potassium uptake protein [Candidatus Omnitrophota bacterium]
MYIVIAGAGRLGLILAKRLTEDKHQVCLIDKSQRLCGLLARELDKVMIICGDATYPEILREAQIEKADVSVAATSGDEDNIIISYLAKELFGIKRTVSRVNDPKHIPLYKYMKVDNPVDSTSIIARVVEEEASFSDVMNLLSIKKGRLSIVRVDIPENSPVANKSLKDIKLPANSVLISILRGPEIVIPSGSTSILPGDEIIAATLIDSEADLTKSLIGKV